MTYTLVSRVCDRCGKAKPADQFAVSGGQRWTVCRQCVSGYVKVGRLSADWRAK